MKYVGKSATGGSIYKAGDDYAWHIVMTAKGKKELDEALSTLRTMGASNVQQFSGKQIKATVYSDLELAAFTREAKQQLGHLTNGEVLVH